MESRKPSPSAPLHASDPCICVPRRAWLARCGRPPARAASTATTRRHGARRRCPRARGPPAQTQRFVNLYTVAIRNFRKYSDFERVYSVCIFQGTCNHYFFKLPTPSIHPAARPRSRVVWRPPRTALWAARPLSLSAPQTTRKVKGKPCTHVITFVSPVVESDALCSWSGGAAPCVPQRPRVPGADQESQDRESCPWETRARYRRRLQGTLELARALSLPP